MAIFQTGLFTSLKGSMSNFTCTKWKGRNVIKSKATVVANPRTEAQTAQRERFAYTSKLYKALSMFIMYFAAAYDKTITVANVFSKLNFPLIVNLESPQSFLPDIQFTTSVDTFGFTNRSFNGDNIRLLRSIPDSDFLIKNDVFICEFNYVTFQAQIIPFVGSMLTNNELDIDLTSSSFANGQGIIYVVFKNKQTGNYSQTFGIPT